MTQARYYRLALIAPIALPLIGWGVGSAASDGATLLGHSSPLRWAGQWAFMMTLGSMYYGLPYLIAAVVLWRASASWSAHRLRRWVWILPTLFIAAAALVVMTTTMIVTYDPAWPDNVQATVLAAAAVGYVEAAGIWLLERAATWAGWLHPDAPAA